MSGKRVLAVYAALLLGFAVVLCRLYLLALHPAYAARAAAQSTVTLQLPARRGNFYDAQGRLLTGLEERWQVVCFPGQGNYDRLYACTDAAGQALLYRSRSRAAPFLLEVSCDPARLGLTGYPTARRYAAVPLCQHLLGYLDSTGHGAARAAAQSTVTLQLPARRGNFYDAQGRLLTGLEERWQVVCFPGQGNYDRLYACTDAAGQALLYRSRSRAAPFLLEVSCDPARLGLTGYPTARRYAAVPLCQHLLGYLDSTGHGAAGLEKALDAVLSGTGENSSLVCAVTAQGTLRTGETARLLQADSGALGVQLTISRPVQRAVEAVAASTMTSGCILVLDTATAAVRASVSVPCYDPEHLADSLQAENSPFLNRALQSYAVGSVFKPVLAATALEAGLQPVFECTGAVVVDGQIFRCAGGVPHGQVDLAAALEKSCNGYFIRLGQQLGAESLLDAAKAFGFGQSLLLAEGFAAEAGQLPTPQELAQSGQLANFSFGQGSLLATPMQVAALFNTLAADGVYRAPYVLQATLDEATGQPVETLSHPRGRRVISAQNAALLRAMLVQVVQQGTAQDAAGLSGGAGGKTGTAQTGQFTPEGTERCNLWFAGFWPAEKPRYTIVVLQDGAVHTAYSGAAIFAQVCTALEAAG